VVHYDQHSARALEMLAGSPHGTGSILRPGVLRRLVRWTRQHHWTAQVVLVLGAVAIAAVVFVFGLLVGAGITPMVAGG
jgi:hypothetical protein